MKGAFAIAFSYPHITAAAEAAVVFFGGKVKWNF